MATKSEKMSLKDVKKLPYNKLNRLINKAKNHLKTDETWQKACNECGEDPGIIDFVPIKFGNVDVSAKTLHGVVILNWRLLCEEDFTRLCSYILHESTHWIQQCFSDHATQSADDGDYLHNPYEVGAFQNQIEYISENEGEKEADDYVDNLLEHHEKDGSEADELKAVLLEKVEATEYYNIISEASINRSPKNKARISQIRQLISKYHPDNKDTGDLSKFKILKDELLRIQNEDDLDDPLPAINPSTIQHFEEKYNPVVENPKPVIKGHPWGDWYELSKLKNET